MQNSLYFYLLEKKPFFLCKIQLAQLHAVLAGRSNQVAIQERLNIISFRVLRFAFHHQHISDNARNKDTINSCGRTDELNMIYRDARK